MTLNGSVVLVLDRAVTQLIDSVGAETSEPSEVDQIVLLQSGQRSESEEGSEN